MFVWENKNWTDFYDRKKKSLFIAQEWFNSFKPGVPQSLWDIGNQNSPRCDATERGVPSGAILFA